MDLPLQLAAEVQRNVLAALAEDIGGGDLTSLLSPGDKRSQGTVVSREDAVLTAIATTDRIIAAAARRGKPTPAPCSPPSAPR